MIIIPDLQFLAAKRWIRVMYINFIDWMSFILVKTILYLLLLIVDQIMNGYIFQIIFRQRRFNFGERQGCNSKRLENEEIRR